MSTYRRLQSRNRAGSVAIPPDRTSIAAETVIDVERWLDHFHENQKHRTEPEWDAPVTLPENVLVPLVKSIAQFELGDGGGPDRLIAWNAESFRSKTKERQVLTDLWFKEEKEHSRLLGDLVRRLGGTHIKSHWSFTAFCLSRKWFGVAFELMVLLVTEIVSTCYYRLLYRHVEDPALHCVCTLILRDEAGHVAFHRDRMARSNPYGYSRIWELFLYVLAHGAATMLWVNHAAALCRVGGSGKEYRREVNRELVRFVRKLRNDQKRVRQQVLGPQLV